MVFAFRGFTSFAVLQSHVHEVWVRLFTSTMKDDLNYSNTDCFENFPFPLGVLELEKGLVPVTEQTKHAICNLKMAGCGYYEFRAALMVHNNEGLTKTYNRFHNPDEQSQNTLKLRELHDTMDRAVLDAYGWTDLKPTCEFLLDYEEEDDEEDETSSSGSSSRKPWRYRWPDDLRDEVLARLLELNKQRAEQERLTGLSTEALSTISREQACPETKSGRAKKRQSTQTTKSAHPNLPGITT
jgi:hypothetical protein